MAAAPLERIFLYGTLRRGGSRDARKFYPGSTFIAAARVRGRLYDFGEYPGLRLDAGAGWVKGEIFEVTAEALAGLDAWEGIEPGQRQGREYTRLGAAVEREDGVRETCWCYEVSEEMAAGRPRIESGDWLAGP